MYQVWTLRIAPKKSAGRYTVAMYSTCIYQPIPDSRRSIDPFVTVTANPESLIAADPFQNPSVSSSSEDYARGERTPVAPSIRSSSSCGPDSVGISFTMWNHGGSFRPAEVHLFSIGMHWLSSSNTSRFLPTSGLNTTCWPGRSNRSTEVLQVLFKI
jgi:hypothetical protein